MVGTPIFHLFDKGPAPVAPYSHAVEVDGWIQLTGLLPNNPSDDALPLPEGIAAQTVRTMENLKLNSWGFGAWAGARVIGENLPHAF